MVRVISSSDDVIDSRDVIARLEELEGELQHGWEEEDKDKKTTFLDWLNEMAQNDEGKFQDEAVEFLALKALAEEGEGAAEDWQYGACLIRESYFVEYCQEMVSDIGDLPKNIPSYLEIDWQKTADNLRVDYSEVEFDGVTYLVR